MSALGYVGKVQRIPLTKTIVIFNSFSEAESAALTMPEDQLVEVEVDSTKNNLRTRYIVKSGQLERHNIDPRSALPVFFTGVFHGTRSQLIEAFGGTATPNDGIQIPALTHPELVKRILADEVPTVLESEWQADPYKRGKWSKGTATIDAGGNPQGWVRTPDLNQALPDSLPPLFARGGTDAKAGSIGKDTMRNLVGHFFGGGMNPSNLPADRPLGVFAEANRDWGVSHPTTSTGGNLEEIYRFDASLGLPAGHTGTEFAPWHVYGVSYTITSNGVVNENAIDAGQVMGEVLLNRERIVGLETRKKALGDGQQRISTTPVANTVYTNLKGRVIETSAVAYISSANGALSLQLNIGGSWVNLDIGQYSVVGAYVSVKACILPNEQYRYVASGCNITSGLEIS